jgi:DNA-binding NarL/FixJ family response regulator
MRPDVALVDIRMPNIDGIEATHLIKSLYPTVKVLILTGFGNRRFVQEALNRGADGFISKHMGGEEILNAIKRVYKGDFVILLGIAENNSWQMELQSTFQPLTKRQREILCKIMEGFPITK